MAAGTQISNATNARKRGTDTLSWYTQQANQAFAPIRQQAETDLTNRFANQGILSSSGAQGETQKQLGLVDQQARDYANKQWQWDVARRDTQKQQGISNAMNLWQMLQAGAIGRAAYQDNVRFPKIPSQFDKLTTGMWSAPSAAFGPIGDPIRSSTQLMGGMEDVYSRQQRNNDFSAAQQAASDAAALTRQNDAQQFSADQAALYNTPVNSTLTWADIAERATVNRMAADSSDPSIQANWVTPSVLLNEWAAKGIDVKSVAKADMAAGKNEGDSPAIAAFKTIYPLTWKQQLTGEVDSPLGTGIPAWGNGTPAKTTPIEDTGKWLQTNVSPMSMTANMTPFGYAAGMARLTQPVWEKPATSLIKYANTPK